MARAIDADDAILQIEKREKYLTGDRCISVDVVKEFIKNRPTIDPVKHGKWVVEHEESIRCSECCFNRAHIKMPMDYCPNCGARMDGE